MQNRRELYKEEILSALNRLWKENGSVKGFRYFADTAYRYSVLGLSDEVQPEVLILGPGIPEALLRAFHIHYRYLLGGSHTMTAWVHHSGQFGQHAQDRIPLKGRGTQSIHA